MAQNEPKPFVRSALRSPQKVRHLTAQDLFPGVFPGPPPSDRIEENDEVLQSVRSLLTDYAGVILEGPPGTSKSWYAREIGEELADRDPERVRFIQFHPSYQYEDFVEGYVPKADGSGFDLVEKHLLQMCGIAEKVAPRLCVIVIDELSRGDPVRIFGEALTYVERTKRGLQFHLSSNRAISIPANLFFLATMNPFDRGVDEADAAFERRFAKIAMKPDEQKLKQFLDKCEMPQDLRDRVIQFFHAAQAAARQNPYARIGHAYFLNCRNEDDLRRLWNHQLRFVFEKAYRLDPQGLQAVVRAWEQVLRPAAQTSEPANASAETEGSVPPEVTLPAWGGGTGA